MRLIKVIGMALATAVVAGCADERMVERVPVAAPSNGEVPRGYDRPKPLPDQNVDDRDLLPEPPFEDPPLVSQKTPEQSSFEQAYRAVGRPRITVFVNRTLEGQVMPANKKAAAAPAPRADRRPYDDRRYDDRRDAEQHYLRSGQYDEGDARALDYQAVENILTDFLACQGTVEIMSPTMARQRLSDEQVKDLQSGRPTAMREIAQQLDTDVLIQVSAHPTRQTPNGLEFRLVGEAINIKGGQQVGRAVVDIPPPLEKTTLNRYTRYMARKLMMDLTQSWTAEEPGREAPGTSSAPSPEKK
jgi:hypothetical protein